MGTFHSALFIDYDNVHSALLEDDLALAARFSNRPLHWLKALEVDLPLPDGVEDAARRIVSRRCYASPQQINSYRRNFTQTGFEVIDCPPLTSHMKNSADIYIVMDIVDYLTRYPHIDEYIILSADADFVPVLNRLRKELKRSAIFTAANTSSAYRNCADRTIDAEFFARHLEPNLERGGVAVSALPTLAQGGPIDGEVEQAIRDCLVAAAKRSGRLPFASAAHALTRGVGERLGGDWAGQRTFTALLAAIAVPELEIDWDAQELRGAVEVDLTGWPADAAERLGEFVADVAAAARKHIPPLPPAAYSLIFDEFAAYYRDEPRTFTDAVNAVADACAAAGFAVQASEIRFIGTGISIQGYRFGADADPAELASLWRLQMFDLCGEPGWMREDEDAALVASWCHASDESIDDARDDFLARTADDIVEPAA